MSTPTCKQSQMTSTTLIQLPIHESECNTYDVYVYTIL
jgi:hypothetical protein